MSEPNEQPAVNVENAGTVNVEPSDGTPADAPTQETPETPPEADATAESSDSE